MLGAEPGQAAEVAVLVQPLDMGDPMRPDPATYSKTSLDAQILMEYLHLIPWQRHPSLEDRRNTTVPQGHHLE